MSNAAEDRILASACKPWEFGDGELPDYESPLLGVFDSGVTYTLGLLAKLLGATDYTPADGTETHDGDVSGTLAAILIAGGLCNADGDLLKRADAQTFVDFVLRHTWPERAKAHGYDAVHSFIKYHPFAKANGTPEADEAS